MSRESEYNGGWSGLATAPAHADGAKDSDDMTTPISKRSTSPAPLAWRRESFHNTFFPDAPGCYAIYLDGKLAYIGQSNSLSTRLSSYRIHRNMFDDPEWVTPWGSFDDVYVKTKPSRRFGDWLMREARLIRRLRPRLNQRGYGYRSVRPLAGAR